MLIFTLYVIANTYHVFDAETPSTFSINSNQPVTACVQLINIQNKREGGKYSTDFKL